MNRKFERKNNILYLQGEKEFLNYRKKNVLWAYNSSDGNIIKLYFAKGFNKFWSNLGIYK